MNYDRILGEIIERGKLRGTPSGYYEKHHILPRCLGGDNSPDNFVKLTAREHYLVHWLLYKVYKTPSLAKAWHSFVMVGSKRYTSHTFAYAREAKRASMLGRKHSEGTKSKMAQRAKGRKQSEETKRKISESKQGWICSEELREVRRKNATGKVGENSCSFKGYYVTPKGIFSTAKAAAEANNTNTKSALRRCKGLTKKDWNNLGWSFINK